MGLGILHRAIDGVAELPLLKSLRRAAYEREFARATRVNYFRGVFDTFEAAAASAPQTKAVGYDNEDSAQLYKGWEKPFLKDYPAMLWIRDGLDKGLRNVFDLGGHVGIKYYAFAPYVRFPADTRWTVVDVPAVVERGRKMAMERSISQLAFSDRIEDADGCDILFASGSLQYLSWTLDEKLARMSSRPRRLVINTTAIHPTRAFFTLNSIGTAFCPYRVQAEPRFIESIEALGYRTLDRWETPKEFVVPFHEGYDLDHYTGFCFESSAH